MRLGEERRVAALRIYLRRMWETPGTTNQVGPASRSRRCPGARKRLLDIVAAATLLLVLLPLIVVVAAAIRLDSRGPAFYRCRRVGYRGREFGMLKFRKMVHDAAGGALTAPEDDRFTRLGRILAKTKLDEIPQLWNVLKGDMSLVGPRPEDPGFVGDAPGRVPADPARPPGDHGPLAARVRARERDPRSRRPARPLRHEAPAAKAQIDCLYVSRRSLGMDLKILFWTAAAVLLRLEVAVHRQSGQLTRRQPRVALETQTAQSPDASVRNLMSARTATATATARIEPPSTSRSSNGNSQTGQRRTRHGRHGHGCRGPSGRDGPAAAKTTVTKAVVLAGGRGTRLAPYTSILPKPLMPVGDRSILELVVDQLERSGINDITFCVGYLSHLIRAVFDNRDNEGVEIDYVHEQDALGTAGPLRLVDGLDETFIAMNGDVLTNLDYADLVRYHQRARQRAHDRDARPADQDRLRRHALQQLGLNGDTQHRITEFQEKPEIVSTVSMGIYVMEPRVLEHVPEGGPFDFPDLVHALLEAGEPVGAYRYDGLWFDIGRKEDYERAVAEWFGADNGNDAGAVEGHVLTESV